MIRDDVKEPQEKLGTWLAYPRTATRSRPTDRMEFGCHKQIEESAQLTDLHPLWVIVLPTLPI